MTDTERPTATAAVSHNSTAAQADWFIDAASGDLHLAETGLGVVDTGIVLPEVSDDFDKESRPQGEGMDLGADEYSVASTAPSVAPILFLLLR